MIKSILRTPRFKRDYKALVKKHYNMSLFEAAVRTLVAQDADVLITRYRDHALKGEWGGYRELHISGDWLLVYRINEDELQLVLTRTGSHDELF
ncbi:type II toxin-antitoxin system YafQ family toxin [Olsenella uli]|uniref:type II toxin-antitoxin system RelE/ParE family toxin n=1 Tax=Olsenella uli TaxID=133926 RepID=UPI001958375D|nr:type II toxin-antitoxin system YafQ family toxin [Olsenella uli]MBM6675804.1 type II toxin-antitoxin system YafQ family toxin [Olsenella uli]